MGPDLFWMAIYALGGLALGLVTSLVGLKKGYEVWGWALIYAFMLVTVYLLDIQDPFWTVMAGSIAAGFAASVVQILLMKSFQSKNSWFTPDDDETPAAIAVHLFFFAFFAAIIFGALFGGVAWALSLI